MPARLPVSAAQATFANILRDESTTPQLPAADSLLRAFRRFAKLGFSVPDVPDADLVLFEYGTFAATGEPAFAISLVRQFERSNAVGEHEAYIQLRCELSYAPSEELSRLGKRKHWGAADQSEDAIEEWSDAVASDPCWNAVAGISALGFVVDESEV